MQTANGATQVAKGREFDWTRPTGVAPAATDVVFARGRSHRRLASIVEVIGLTMLVPLGVLLAAAPILLLIWVGRTLITWFGGE